jgi:hypothetical protein
MTVILSIDPSSNKAEKSNTGIVVIENGKLINYWVASYGVRGFKEWFDNNYSNIEYDVAVFEHFEARDNSKSKDNTVIETIEEITKLIPDIKPFRNGGYKSDVPDSLLKALDLWKFGKSHHQDVRAAARLALFYAMRTDIEDFINGVGKELYERI